MKSKEEVTKLRDEFSGFMDLILNMHPSMQNPMVIQMLVLIHDTLTWALDEPARRSDLGIGFDLVIENLRLAMRDVADKQHKHRNPLNN